MEQNVSVTGDAYSKSEVVKLIDEATNAERHGLIAVAANPVAVVAIGFRDAFFGYTYKTDAAPLKLLSARWVAAEAFHTGAAINFALVGPVGNVSPRADMIVHGFSYVVECTPEAIAAWESA